MNERIADRAAQAGCWTARIAGLLLALMFVALVIGEGPPPLRVHFVAMAGMACGLLLAWKWEGLGGAITLAGFLLLWLVDRRFVAAVPWAFTVLPALVGLVYVICWARLRGEKPGKLPLAIWVALGVFVALAGNEAFGNPPLMTVRKPSAAVVGTWRSADVVLSLGSDGRLTGTIDGKQLGASLVEGNRSWFGKLLNWRTDYVIRGYLNGWLMVAGTHLRGDVQMDGRQRRFEVVK